MKLINKEGNPIINTNTFLEAFKCSLQKYDSQEIINSYRNNKLWTDFIKIMYVDIEESLRSSDDIANAKDINLYREFHNIDATYWLENELHNEEISEKLELLDIRNPKHKKVWKFLLAIEHENDSRDWFYELNQLMNFNCPLKVLISYAKNLETQSENYRESILAIINELAIYSNHIPGEEFVILLGNNAKTLETLNALEYYVFSYKYNSQIDRFEISGAVKTINHCLND